MKIGMKSRAGPQGPPESCWNANSARSTISVNKEGIGLVTEADLAAKEIILEMLRNHFPKDNILFEEAGVRDLSSARP